MSRIVLGEDDRVGKWVCERIGAPWCPNAAKAIGLERDGRLVGGVVCDRFNGASVCMHIASDGSRNWCGRDFLRFCFAYAFIQMKVNKVIGVVESTNLEAMRFDDALGFVEEARIKDAAPGGDLVFLTMTRDKCRWL
jgi:RimJ/RimL family protein N-acetyltransferase